MRVSGPVIQHNYGRTIQNGFGGLNHNLGATDGEIFDMRNMCSDFYPLLATRELSWKRESRNEGILEFFAFDIFDGHTAWIGRIGPSVAALFFDNELVTTLPLGYGERQMVRMGTRILIWPDKWFFDMRSAAAKDYSEIYISVVPHSEEIEGNIVIAQHLNEEETEFITDYFIFKDGAWEIFTPAYSMEAFTAPGDAVFEDGTYKGQPAERNTIKFSKSYTDHWTENWRLNVGDAVEISGAADKENNKIPIIREIDTDEDYIYLRFYEGTFTNNSSDDDIVITRKVPDLDFICEHKNRLWGCKGKEIFCSHQGDPLNWYEYESLADGAWAVEIGSGELTGCVSYNYPLFFTENEIYTVLGNSPMEYALSVTPNTFGLAKGSHRSFAIVREYLFYHSPYGFCYYYGSMPQLCSAALGTEYFRNAVGGGKGGKYYVSCETENGLTRNYVFDATRGMWHKEQNAFASKIAAFAWDGDLYAIMGDGVYTMGLPRNKPSDNSEFGDDSMPSQVVFAPWDMDSVNKKQVKSIYIRHEVEGTLTARVYVDGVENASLRKTMTGKGMTEIVGIPQRCDRWYLQLDGAGAWRVYSIAYDFYEGSAKK